MTSLTNSGLKPFETTEISFNHGGKRTSDYLEVRSNKFCPSGWSGFGLLFCHENKRCQKRDQMRLTQSGHHGVRDTMRPQTGLDISVISTYLNHG